MLPIPHLFLSNRLELLAQRLKLQLFGSEAPLFRRRLVIVYGPAMQNWLTLRFAQDPLLQVCMGIEWVHLPRLYDTLLPHPSAHFPTQLELSLAIESLLREQLAIYPNMNEGDQSEWQPLLQYLRWNPAKPTPKMDRRISGLSRQLGQIFVNYGKFGVPTSGWQAQVWSKLFSEESHWTYPLKAFDAPACLDGDLEIHCFSISYLAQCEFAFLQGLSKQHPVHFYLLSPCALFWSDIMSDRERSRIHDIELEEFLRDRNPLLANFGRMGREMIGQIEKSEVQTTACYILPKSLQDYEDERLQYEDISLEESPGTLTLLESIQTDMLLLRNPEDTPPRDIEELGRSIQLHFCSNKRREVEVLYHNLLGLIAQDPSLTPSDIIVMAPRITEYAPYIESQFGSDGSLLDYQILDLGMHQHNAIVQGFLLLLGLKTSRWDASSLLQLFAHPAFRRKQRFSQSDYDLLRRWIIENRIHWGHNQTHRNELLKRRHCSHGAVDQTAMGTWEHGLNRLMSGLTSLQHDRSERPHTIPFRGIEFSQAPLLSRFIEMLHHLKDDLTPLHDGTLFTLDEWVRYLRCLLENYFQPDEDESDWEELEAQLERLRQASSTIPESRFPFTSIEGHLHYLFENCGFTFKENHLQSIRFCSLVPLRSIPAKVIALMGMNEGEYPRIVPRSSLYQIDPAKSSLYHPNAADYDRYLFLEALHSARKTLLLSYQGIDRKEGSALNPSLLIQELFSYLDRHYRVQGELPSSYCQFRHPRDGFDPIYFTEHSPFKNYSMEDYRIAKVSLQPKETSFVFLEQFSVPTQSPTIAEDRVIDLRQLNRLIRNPAAFHLEKALNLSMQEQEQSNDSDLLTLSALEISFLKKEMLKEPLEQTLYYAQKEGKLPLGLFQQVALKKLHRECAEQRTFFEQHAIEQKDIFTIEFSTGYAEPMIRQPNYWIVPAPRWETAEGYRINITGKLTHATPQGLLVKKTNAFDELWKEWPNFLMYRHAVKLFPENLQSNFLPYEDGKVKEAAIDDPLLYLRELLSYHDLCLGAVSPLYPNWIELFLSADGQKLQKQFDQLYDTRFGGWDKEELRWLFQPEAIPSADIALEQWKPWAHRIAEEFATILTRR